MSLTNPNTPVSQQDLQDFYHKLLPYMGGSFGMIANKFSKGDMYSTDEKMIGQWIDGKPVYQKVIEFTIGTNRAWTQVAHNIANIETIVGLDTFVDTSPSVYTAGYQSDAYCMGYASTIKVGVNQNAFSGKTARIILQYTKTTDSAISIGNDTDYSTEEKIVGTWIDGKPIYQKTFNTTTAFTVNVSTSKTDTLISSGVDKIINQNGYVIFSVGQTELIPAVQLGFWEMFVRKTSAGAVNFIIANKDSSAKSFSGYAVTIQYTKTTS